MTKTKEIMEKIYSELEKHEEYREILNSWDWEWMKDINNYNDDEEIDVHRVVKLVMELEQYAEHIGDYSKENSEADHLNYLGFRDKETNKEYAFVTGWNSWDATSIDQGVYEVKSEMVRQYTII